MRALQPGGELYNKVHSDPEAARASGDYKRLAYGHRGLASLAAHGISLNTLQNDSFALGIIVLGQNYNAAWHAAKRARRTSGAVIILRIAAAVVTGGASSGALTFTQAAVFSAVSTYAVTGDVKAAAVAATASYVGASVGGETVLSGLVSQATSEVTQHVIYATIFGVISELNGGDFLSGIVDYGIQLAAQSLTESFAESIGVNRFNLLGNETFGFRLLRHFVSTGIHGLYSYSRGGRHREGLRNRDLFADFVTGVATVSNSYIGTQRKLEAQMTLTLRQGEGSDDSSSPNVDDIGNLPQVANSTSNESCTAAIIKSGGSYLVIVDLFIGVASADGGPVGHYCKYGYTWDVPEGGYGEVPEWLEWAIKEGVGWLPLFGVAAEYNNCQPDCNVIMLGASAGGGVTKVVKKGGDLFVDIGGKLYDASKFGFIRTKDKLYGWFKRGEKVPTRAGRNNSIQGSVNDANFAQDRIRSDRIFSPDGQDIYSVVEVQT